MAEELLRLSCASCAGIFEYEHRFGRLRKFCEPCREPRPPKPATYKPCATCGVQVRALANRRHCESCSGAGKNSYGCPHPKTLFATTGRERKLCEVCRGPLEKKPRQPYTPKVVIEAQCVQCGSVFSKNAAKKTKFCSDRCRTSASTARLAKIGADAKGVRTVECGFCKSAFEVGYGDLRWRYCTYKCKRSAQYAKGTGSTHRRRAKAAGVEFEYFDKRAVFERDGWRCQLCGVATTRPRGREKPTDAQLDHVIPFAAGGAHTLENAQCACRACNAKKLDGPPAGQMGLFASLVNEDIRSRRRPKPITEPALVAGSAF
jgi:hypothetical protein